MGAADLDELRVKLTQEEARKSWEETTRSLGPETQQLTAFKRAELVNPWADLKIGIVVSSTKAASWNVRLLILAGTLIVLVSFAWMGRSFHRKESEANRP